ncbi:hypothetical protein SDJN03_00733, partial [Cucurbita argyrosperma subsp. sororia]
MPFDEALFVVLLLTGVSNLSFRVVLITEFHLPESFLLSSIRTFQAFRGGKQKIVGLVQQSCSILSWRK